MQGIAVVNEVRKTFSALLADRGAVTALEYAMIAALIATSCVSILTSLGVGLQGVFSTVSNAL
jgi:Flp pilus assembly pilin Flp